MTGRRQPDARIAVIGTGSFAATLVKAILADRQCRAEIYLIGRSERSIRRAVTRAAARSPRVVHEIVLPLGPDADLTTCLQAVRPHLVVVCASLFSPYGTGDIPPPGGGFATSMLLQAPIAVRAAEAVAKLADRPCLVNACYPDAVNPLLAALNLPVQFGVGNVQTLEAGLALRDVRIVAHHRHLKPVPAAEEAQIWAPNPQCRRDELNLLRRWDRQRLNELGATAAGQLLAALVRGETVHTNLPGPAGLPGGYPVRVNLEHCEPDLPDGLTLEQAVTTNRRHCAAEGVEVAHGEIRFTGDAAQWLDRWGVVPGGALPVHDWAQAMRKLVAVSAGQGVGVR